VGNPGGFSQQDTDLLHIEMVFLIVFKYSMVFLDVCPNIQMENYGF
jgi:hypothetical protein